MPYNQANFKKQLASAEEWLKKEFQQIRTGQASPSILDGVRAESYGTPVPLKDIASIMLEGARTLRVSPWDKSQVKDIEKAITAANLGLSVVVDDQGLRVIFPELTSDRRADVVKIAKEKVEDAKKQVRRDRDVVVKELQAQEKAGGTGKDEIFRLKGEVQKFVDEANKKFDEMMVRKEKEILN